MKCLRICLILPVLLFIFNSGWAQLTYKELRVVYDSAWTFKNLRLIPIRFKPVSTGDPAVPLSQKPITLAEALQKHKVKLEEIQKNKAADVNWLELTNKSKEAVIVQSGEIVGGGKQDRMIGETKIIPPGSKDYIHVFCVEKRRWDDKAKAFKHSGVANSEVKKIMDVTGRQSDVWKEVDRQFTEQKKSSDTWSYLNLNNEAKIDTSYINFFTRKYYNGGADYAGFIFITGDRIMSAEIFASSSLLDIAFANMLKSYVISAVASGAQARVETGQARAFMDKFMITEEAQRSYLNAHGKVYKSGGKTIHLVAYPQ